MKKPLYLLICTIAVISWQVPGIQTKPKNDVTVGESLQDHYNFMTESADFVEFENAISDFYKKSKRINDDLMPVDENTFLSWLSSNISSTSFKNYDQAFKDWQLVKLLGNKIVAGNKPFFTALLIAHTYELGEIIHPAAPVTGVECIDDVAGNFVNLKQNTTNIFVKSLKATGDKFNATKIQNLIAYEWLRYQGNIEFCKRVNEISKKGCE